VGRAYLKRACSRSIGKDRPVSMNLRQPHCFAAVEKEPEVPALPEEIVERPVFTEVEEEEEDEFEDDDDDDDDDDEDEEVPEE